MGEQNTNCLRGSASLLNDLGERLMVTVRGGRIYIGNLKSMDQFGNIILHNTTERIHVYDKFCDVPQGILIIRGENIVIIGKMKEDYDPAQDFIRVSEEEIFRFQAEKVAALEEAAKKRHAILARRGIYMPEVSEFLFDDS